MNDYTNWDEETLAVTCLSLDPRNPRMPEAGDTPSQREIVAELVEHDNVYELARDITDHGYYPTEVLVAVEEDSQTVVVEGNRRLAAVKCLISPELAPHSFVNRFSALRQRISPEAIRKIRVLLAPSREAAAPLIINRHTKKGVQGWEPAQQAKYIALLVSGDVPLEDQAKQFGLTPGQISGALHTHTLHQIPSNLPLPYVLLSQVRNPRSFSTSTLDRLISSPKVMEFLGAEFDENGEIIGKIQVKEFTKGYARIISDIAQGNINSRALNTTTQIKQYISGLGKDAPNRSRKGSFTSATILGVPEKRQPAKAVSKPSRARRRSASLVPMGFQCKLANHRINEIFKETKKLRVDGLENAVAVLFRIFVELSLSNYLEKSGKIKPILEKARKEGKPRSWSPTFRQMLRAMLQDPDVELTPSALKALNRAADNDAHALSLDSLDQFVHNRLEGPSERELRRFWDQFQELL